MWLENCRRKNEDKSNKDWTDFDLVICFESKSYKRKKRDASCTDFTFGYAIWFELQLYAAKYAN